MEVIPQLFLFKPWKPLTNLYEPMSSDCKWTSSQGCSLAGSHPILWLCGLMEVLGLLSTHPTSEYRNQKKSESVFPPSFCCLFLDLQSILGQWNKARWRALSSNNPWEKVELCLWKHLLGYPPSDHTQVGEEISARSANFIHVLLTCPFTFPQAKDDFFIEGCFSSVIRAQNKAAVYTNFFCTVRII